jgi:hypothetical protein
MQLKFRRTLSKNKLGYFYINIPIVLANALDASHVDLVWNESDGTVKMVPIKFEHDIQ